MTLLQQVISGIATGFIYALIGLALILTLSLIITLQDIFNPIVIPKSF